MPPALNRTAVLLDLAAFLAVSVFCISTEAPIIQQDILKRCQDALLMHHIPIKGLSVDGRDVLMTGSPGSALVSPLAYSLLADLPGVRTVSTRLVYGGNSSADASDSFPSASLEGGSGPAAAMTQQTAQQKIDQILDNQGITFKADTASLTLDSEQVLDKVAVYLAGAPNLVCEIRGYDTQPGELHENWVLALQRALATEDYLEMRGVANWRMTTRAFHMSERAPVTQSTKGRGHSDRPIDLILKTRE